MKIRMYLVILNNCNGCDRWICYRYNGFRDCVHDGEENREVSMPQHEFGQVSERPVESGGEVWTTQRVPSMGRSIVLNDVCSIASIRVGDFYNLASRTMLLNAIQEFLHPRLNPRFQFRYIRI